MRGDGHDFLLVNRHMFYLGFRTWILWNLTGGSQALTTAHSTQFCAHRRVHYIATRGPPTHYITIRTSLTPHLDCFMPSGQSSIVHEV